MPAIFLRLILIVLTCFSLGTAAFGQGDSPAEAAASAQQKAFELQKTLQKMNDDLRAARNELAVSKKSLETLENSKKTVEQKIVEQQKILTEQTAALESIRKKIADSNKALKDAETDPAANQENVEKAKAENNSLLKELSSQESEVEKSQIKLNELQANANQVSQMMSEISAAIKASNESIEKQVAALTAVQSNEAEMWKQAETAHRKAGSWVSFSDQIAPILHKRCLACHNEGKPRGQLQMDSYEKLMRGGESGQLIDLDAPELSTLVAMVEDGSMPKDDDPLLPEQISLLKRWVAMGARLDAAADPSASFIEIMPRPQHPQPPQTYPRPIPVNAVAFAPDGTRVASAGYHEILLWALPDGSLTQRISGIAERVFAIEFMPDSNLIVVAAGTPGEIGEVKVFDVATGQLIQDLFVAATVTTSARFSGDGSRLAVSNVDGSIQLFETVSWKKTMTIHEHSDWVNDIAWSPDGTKIVSASRDNTAKIFDATSGENLLTFNGHNAVVTCVTFLPNGEEIATGGADRRLRIWKASDASEVRNVTGFGSELTSLQVVNEAQLLTASADQKVRLHAAADQKIEKTYTGPASAVLSLDRSDAGSQIVAGTIAGKLFLWSLDQETAVATWEAFPSSSQNESNNDENEPEK